MVDLSKLNIYTYVFDVSGGSLASPTPINVAAPPAGVTVTEGAATENGWRPILIQLPTSGSPMLPVPSDSQKAGIALVWHCQYSTAVVDFVAYGNGTGVGTTPSDGPASGTPATDTGLVEDDSTDPDDSISREGSGNTPGDSGFSWEQEPGTPNSPGDTVFPTFPGGGVCGVLPPPSPAPPSPEACSPCPHVMISEFHYEDSAATTQQWVELMVPAVRRRGVWQGGG
mgnify:CR=1 FL=1